MKKLLINVFLLLLVLVLVIISYYYLLVLHIKYEGMENCISIPLGLNNESF